MRRGENQKFCGLAKNEKINYSRSSRGCPAARLTGKMGCNGLAILSRHEIVEVEFLPFNKKGINHVEVHNMCL